MGSSTASSMCSTHRYTVLRSGLVSNIIPLFLSSFPFFSCQQSDTTHSRNLWWLYWLWALCKYFRNVQNRFVVLWDTGDAGLSGSGLPPGTFRRKFSSWYLACLPLLWLRLRLHVCSRVEVGPKETTLAALESVACSLPPAVNHQWRNIQALPFYKASLCLCPASELSTILEIVSSLLKRFQTMTVAPVRFPVNGLASFPILRTRASSESKDLPVGVYLPMWSQSFPSRFSFHLLMLIH